MKVYYVENQLYRIKSDRIFKIYNAIALFFSKKSISLQPLLKNDLVAQLVEHIPFKDGVLGSNPSWITFFSNKRANKVDDLVAQLVEHIPFKDGVLGSNPSWITKKTA